MSSEHIATIARGKVPLTEDCKLVTPDGMVEIPLPLITLGSPAWQGMANIIPLAEADADVEVGLKLKFDTIHKVEMTFSWVPPNSGVSQKEKKGGIILPPGFGAPATRLQGSHQPLVVIDLQISDISPDAVAEVGEVLVAARDFQHAAVDLLNTLDGRIIRILFQKIEQKNEERSFYYIRRQTVRVNKTL